MEPIPIHVSDFIATTLGFLVFLVGAQVTRSVRLLRDFNIPEPVSGGLIAALITYALFVFVDLEITFGLAARDYLLVVFFAAIGLNARFTDLAAGGKPLAILLVLTVAFIVIQNAVGILSATVFGLPSQMGVLLGSAALIGGHGTAIAWAPEIAEITGIEEAEELGVAVATLGLVMAALVGGPIAKFLIESRGLQSSNPEEHPTVGIEFADEHYVPITHIDLMRVLFVLNCVIIVGYGASEGIASLGLELPAFVPCLMIGILVGNLTPIILPRLPPVSRTPALSLVSDFALGTFLAMSLMALQLWTLAGLGSLMVFTMVAQTLAAVAFVILVLFFAMGAQYRAAVLAAGFAGFALGATPTAIANMNAVTKRYGPSPIAFVILPLVSAFFVDLANSGVIQTILSF
ncbi:MAG: sodium/glutamate symporter [Pseudomonadota bacterium]